MKPKQNARHNRQGRPNQQKNQRRNNNKGRQNQNQNRSPQQPSSPNRQVDSRGPAGVQRGNAKQLYEKYKILAQDKRASDRHESESLYQYADHYYRIYADFAASEAASQAAKEKERARKAQEEIENRANSIDGGNNNSDSQNSDGLQSGISRQVDLPQEICDKSQEISDKRPDTEQKAEVKPDEPENEPALTLNLGLPDMPLEAEKTEKPASPKRRGRPRKKLVVEENSEENSPE